MQRTQPKILGYSTVSFLCGDCIEKPFLVIIAVGFRDICCNHLLALEHHKLVLLSACNTVSAQSLPVPSSPRLFCLLLRTRISKNPIYKRAHAPALPCPAHFT